MRCVRTLPVALTLLAAVAPAAGQTTVTFENPTLSQPLSGPNTFQNGSTLSPPGSFTTAGATFNNSYNATFDTWSGWAYSNVTNVTTPGFGNQYAAYALPNGGGDNSSNFGVAFTFNPGDATIQLPVGMRPASVRLTNTTYAALSMRDGDQFAKKFGGTSGNDPDFFLLTITGLNGQNQPTGSVNFYLADYRFTDNSLDYIVAQWTTVDLSALGEDTSRLSFALTSSDVGAFGMNTPAYFALDNLVLTPVPEPSLVGWSVAVAFGAWRLIRRQKAHGRTTLDGSRD
jgi:hypothetical protein